MRVFVWILFVLFLYLFVTLFVCRIEKREAAPSFVMKGLLRPDHTRDHDFFMIQYFERESSPSPGMAHRRPMRSDQTPGRKPCKQSRGL